MIEKFGTLAEASAFVEEKRAEGYHAEILNEGVAQLWGPPTVGGYRVMVSDEKIPPESFSEEEEEEPENQLTATIRRVILGIVGLGILSALFLALLHFRSTISFLIAALICAVAILVGGGFIAFSSTSLKKKD